MLFTTVSFQTAAILLENNLFLLLICFLHKYTGQRFSLYTVNLIHLLSLCESLITIKREGKSTGLGWLQPHPVKRALCAFSHTKPLLASAPIPERVVDTLEPQDQQSDYVRILFPPYN